MDYFRSEEGNIDFMVSHTLFYLSICPLNEIYSDIKLFVSVIQVACMQFINIVVHSVEDMNFRVHLQYEFTKLGLDDYLEVRRKCQNGQSVLTQSYLCLQYSVYVQSL